MFTLPSLPRETGESVCIEFQNCLWFCVPSAYIFVTLCRDSGLRRCVGRCPGFRSSLVGRRDFGLFFRFVVMFRSRLSPSLEANFLRASFVLRFLVRAIPVLAENAVVLL